MKLFDILTKSVTMQIKNIIAKHGEEYFKNNFSMIGRNHINK